MKKLSIDQMESLNGGSKFLSCTAQVAGGMGWLATAASIGIWALGPVGWFAFGVGTLALAADIIADPTACD